MISSQLYLMPKAPLSHMVPPEVRFMKSPVVTITINKAAFSGGSHRYDVRQTLAECTRP